MPGDPVSLLMVTSSKIVLVWSINYMINLLMKKVMPLFPTDLPIFPSDF